jgi:hypothetical protein
MRTRVGGERADDPGVAVLLGGGAGAGTDVVDAAAGRGPALGPADDATAVTAAQLRSVIARLMAAGRWKPGDPDIIIVLDSSAAVRRRKIPTYCVWKERLDRPTW